MSIKHICLLVTTFCCLSACGQTPKWTGKLVYGYSGSVNEYSFALKTDKVIIPDATEPCRGVNGDVYFINRKFPKVGELVRKFTTTGQFKTVLDLSTDNPDYKTELENYSVIRGTGIAGVIYGMSDPAVSPDGKWLSVTIYGGPSLAFRKNCVAVFDVSTQKLVTQFDDKYYGTWTPDGRLLMSGTHKKGSVDGKLYDAPTPGIFITDKNLGQLKRIDPELDDPSPYHAVMSPDQQSIAFMMNRHVWIMKTDGTALRQLTDTDNDNEESYPCFSPDGKFLACWSYKTFEKSYFTAIAVVPANASKPVVLTNNAAVWPRDKNTKRLSGGSGQLYWLAK